MKKLLLFVNRTMDMATLSFSKWYGSGGIEEFIINQTGCKPYSGAGINPRIDKKTTILKSVDDTYYYDDDMSDINNIKYTLFGHNGDQNENEKKFNEPLLNPDKTQHIYLYRVKNSKKLFKAHIYTITTSPLFSFPFPPNAPFWTTPLIQGQQSIILLFFVCCKI